MYRACAHLGDRARLDKNTGEWQNTATRYKHGGVGAPVGLTVFKTAGGSLGAVPGGFDSHTPLPNTARLLFVPSAITLEKPEIPQ